MLKSIQLNGFKSFAKKDTLIFESPITAIVGPNGSGKSNAAEAFRFVLGEQGSKSMRIKKSADLIWGGSHTLPRGSRAGVKVVLDNSNNKLNIDFNEVIIERSVLRDGINEYQINGTKVRLKDIQDLLAGANVGSSGHHIISQGEADRVLGASPNDRREMLEDALGLKSYQLKKVEAKRNLEATRINLEKVDSRCRELLPHLKFLSRQMAKVEQGKQVRDDLRSLAVQYFTYQREDIYSKEKTIRDSLQEPTIRLENIESKIAQVRKAIDSEPEKDNNLDSQEVDKQKQKLISMRSVQAEIRIELGKIRGQIEMLQIVEQKTEALPSTIAIEEVRSIVESIVEELESENISRARDIAESFINNKLSIEQEESTEDGELEKEKKLLLITEQELREQVTGQERAIKTQEENLQQKQIIQNQEQQKTTENERDLYKATAEYNNIIATLADLNRRDADTINRKELLERNLGEVQILLKEELDFNNCDVISKSNIPESRDIERLKIRLEQYNSLDTGVIEEFNEAKKHYDYLSQESLDLSDAVDKLQELIRGLDTHMQIKFNNGLELINREFNNFFTTLFDGGNATLKLQDDNVYVEVALPRKKITTLETLSGGERALTSIALIFAMSQVNPPPFIILDETDAALDEANSQRYARVVKSLSKRSQVILITHNRATMAAADILYGVTMGNDGASKLLSVRLTEVEQYAK